MKNSPLIAINDDCRLLDNTEFHLLLVVSSGGCDTLLFKLREQIISDIACPGIDIQVQEKTVKVYQKSGMWYQDKTHI